MEKILYISSSDPKYTNGGSIGTLKYLKTFKELEKENKIKLFSIVSKEKRGGEKEFTYEIERKKWKAYLSRLLGLSDQLELEIRKAIKLIEKEKIEIVIIQSSRLGNFTRKIRSKFPRIKIIQNFDNFEYKFSKMYTQNMNNLIKFIELRNIKKTEENAIRYSDVAIFLTEKDKKSVELFYKIELHKSKVVPLIYENKMIIKNKNPLKLNQIIFTGSLDMEANIEASLFLIDNFKKIRKETSISKLIIAGRNPSKRLSQKIKFLKEEKNINLVSNPTSQEMQQLLLNSLLYVSPVSIGSGMKTKFLEAISFGLPIVASEHTMIGYDLKSSKEQEFIEVFEDDNLNEFIEKLQVLKRGHKDTWAVNIIKFFNENYSKEKIIRELKKVIIYRR